MARFRVKHTEFEAEPYRAGMEDEWAHLWHSGALLGRYETRHAAECCPHKKGPGSFGTSVAVVKTPTGRDPVWPGDWIIRNDRGERRVLTPDELFGADYVFVDSCRHEVDAIDGSQPASGQDGWMPRFEPSCRRAAR